MSNQQQYSRRGFLGLGIAAGTLLSNYLNSGLLADGKTNVVLIMGDDLGYECLNCYGGTSYKTPNLDKLAADGMRFDNCFANPLCTPSRVQLMTGKYNHRNYKKFGELDLKEKTFAHYFKDAGYATAIAGKWQLGGGEKGPHQAGFDEYCLWQVFEGNSRGSRYADPKIHLNGKLLEDTKDKYGDDVFCDFLSGFMEKNKQKPFLAYYPMCLPHEPFEATPDSTPKKFPKQYFPDMIAYMDKVVARLVKKLDDLGLRKNTLILFTGDNGTSLQITSEMKGKKVKGGKSLTTDNGMHVPLIANWSGTIAPGKVNTDLIDLTDFLPTMLEAANLKAPALDGRSFLPQLKGQKSTPREWIFCHYDPEKGGIKPARFAFDHKWKLYDDGRLFDRAADIDESQPIKADAAEAAEARKRLQAVLDKMK
jgi:arylsulfatase A